MDLKEWSIDYVKNRDLIQRKLVDFKDNGDSVRFNFKDGPHDYIVKENLGSSVLDLKNDVKTTIVCINVEENLHFLLDNWGVLKEKDVRFLFVNLVSGSKWIINPKSHSMIADPESLEMGLRSMYDQATSE